MPHHLVTRLRRSVHRARVVAVRSTRRAAAQWRSSLQLRVVTTALAIGFAAIAVLGLYLSTSVRDGIYEQRIAAIDKEAAALTAQVAENFSDAATTSDGELQTLLLDTMATLGATSGSTADEYFLMHELGTTAQVPDFASRADLTDVVITSELREANLSPEGDQVLQAVGIPPRDGSGMASPGVIVGSTVQASPDARYEIYYLYSLEPEQETLSFVHRVLLAGGFGMLALLGVVTWTMARQTVTPVTRAATVAERLAEGHLSERMPGARGTDEMASLARSFNEMAESLQDQIRRMEELSAMQRRFVSDVSHELRTPLTTIRMASEIIHESRHQMDEDAARSAELLLGQIDRFESLLSDLLEISRFDAGAAVLDAERRDLRDLVMSVVEQAAPLANTKDVRVSVRLPDADAAADFDPPPDRAHPAQPRRQRDRARRGAAGRGDRRRERPLGRRRRARLRRGHDQAGGRARLRPFLARRPGTRPHHGRLRPGPGDRARGRAPARRAPRRVGPPRAGRELPADAAAQRRRADR